MGMNQSICDSDKILTGGMESYILFHDMFPPESETLRWLKLGQTSFTCGVTQNVHTLMLHCTDIFN